MMMSVLSVERAIFAVSLGSLHWLFLLMGVIFPSGLWKVTNSRLQSGVNSSRSTSSSSVICCHMALFYLSLSHFQHPISVFLKS
jgi:hypothetical protein